MVVATTSASSLAVGSALVSVPADQRADAVVLLTLMAGALMIIAGFLKLGRYTRFVSHSVMTGFLTGHRGQHHLWPDPRPDRRDCSERACDHQGVLTCSPIRA